MNETVGLTELPRALREFTGGSTATYQTLYREIVNGNLPAERSSSGRWLVRRTDLPRIAKTLGFSTKKEIA